MPDTKISEMDLATEVSNADFFAVVQGEEPANFKCTRVKIFTGMAGESMELIAQSDGRVSMSTVSGGGEVVIDAVAHEVLISSEGTIVVEADDRMDVNADAIALKNNTLTKGVLIEDDGSTEHEDAVTIFSDQNVVIHANDTVTVEGEVNTLVKYVAGNPSDWGGSAPVWEKDAIDRLAACVAADRAAPVP